VPFCIDLSGRRALVTGAGRNVGRAIAAGLAEAGAEVVVNDVVEKRALEVAAEIASSGAAARAACFDVASWEESSRAVSQLAPDILVNNAGNAGEADIASLLAPFVETGPSEWEPFVSVNLHGVLNCTRAALPAMVERGWGRVVTVVSDAGRAPSSRLGAYAAAKAGAAGLMRALCRELGPAGVTLNAVSLGIIEPPAREGEDEGARRRTLERLARPYAVPRLGRPEDVVGVVVLLASDLASWVTGQTYPVDGGLSPAR
jgi:NAD(P)-dependent dehydrogenase (short-subunit alcohol dehydrogenase family)